jgi:hypothetical protein
MTLSGTELCIADIELDAGAPLPLGQSPWRNRRVSYIKGGAIRGERLQGEVLPGGGDWSELGMSGGDALTLIDARSVWRTDAGTLIYVAYQGRLVIPAAVLTEFRDPQKVEGIPTEAYGFRTLMTFETADSECSWLNAMVAVGLGQRTAAGVRYRIFTVD